MTAVWDLQLPDSEKLVLLALADNANDAGVCWPSVATIARKCSKGERTVQGAIKSLEASGHLSRIEKVGKGVTYTIHPRSACAPQTSHPRNEQHPTPAAAAPKPSRTTIPKKTTSSQVARARRKAEFHRLPDEWKPDRFGDGSAAREVVDRRGLPWAKVQLEDFRAWAANAEDKDGQGRKLDWQSAFAKWINKADREDKGNDGQRNGRQQSTSGLGRTVDAVQLALQRATGNTG